MSDEASEPAGAGPGAALALERLGEFLTATEARWMAAVLDRGGLTSVALREVGPVRRAEVRALFQAAGVGHLSRGVSVAVLRAIAGAKAGHRSMTPVWTMPGVQATVGHLTGELHRLVTGARVAVTCATYNFAASSAMWAALDEVSERPDLDVRIYVDAEKGRPQAVAARLPRAHVFTTVRDATGRPLVSHAKFVVIDHTLVLLTSANFSEAAERRNVEFGLLIHDTGLAESLESTMAGQHGRLYERVRSGAGLE